MTFARQWRLLGALLVAGCADGPFGPPPDLAIPIDLARHVPICSDGDGGVPPATLANVERVFAESCAVPMCHDGSIYAARVKQDLRPGHARAAIVQVAAAEMCDGGAPLTRVVPGDAGASWLYQKVTNPNPCAGTQMPQSEVGPLPIPSCQMELLRRWIAAGAPP